jgi:hypothetical protein
MHPTDVDNKSVSPWTRILTARITEKIESSTENFAFVGNA